MTGPTKQRRSLLFVPGSEPRKIDKARGAGADALLIDLEDGVLPEDKERARGEVAAAAARGGFGDTEVCVRLNAPSTADFASDVAAAAAAGVRSFMVPKCEDGAAVGAAVERLAAACGAPVMVLALIESAAGILHAEEIAAVEPVDALCFGHADFALDLGVSDSEPSRGSIYHARCQLVLAAKAKGRAAIDTVCLAVHDAEAFRRDAVEGLRLGFEGKLCIHPAQVAIANEVFAPTREQVERALRVLEAAAAARRDGHGVFAFEGQMVDAPLIERCERLLERARRAGGVDE